MRNNYIAVDWGSTNLRAWLYRDGLCVDMQQSESGVTRLGGETPRQVFERLLSPWLAGEGIRHVIMAGMVGSNAGWLSVPYLRCPTPLSDLPRRLTRIEEMAPLNVFIVPGICIEDDDNCNVMRGEETQLIGAHREAPAPLYLMPGTHSKWVRMDGDVLTGFRTVMTGELHHLLMRHSLVGAGLPAQEASPEAFRSGLETGFTQTNILRTLFETRAAHVLGRLQREAVAEWLSGLLIGNEVAQMCKEYPLASGESLTVVGNRNLSQRYAQALQMAGVPFRTVDGDNAFQSGIGSIANELD